MTDLQNPATAAPSLEQRARQRVALKKGFYIHLLVFVLVNAGLYLMAALSGFDGWPGRRVGLHFFPTGGWFIGLAVHGVVVFLRLQGEGMTQTLVDREIAALQRKEGGNGR